METALLFAPELEPIARSGSQARSGHGQAIWIAGISLVLHVALAASLSHGQPQTGKLAKLPTRVEIQVRRAPPKVPSPPPAAPAVEPPPAPKIAPRARAPRPEPAIATPVEAVATTQVPVSDEGTLPQSDAPPSVDPNAVIGPPVIAPTPVAPPPAAPKRVEAREGANYRHNPRPAYPRKALREGWEGSVGLRVQVSPSGRPTSIRIERSSGREALDEAAREAVNGWTFTPASVDGRPASGWVSVPIVFRLNQ